MSPGARWGRHCQAFNRQLLPSCYNPDVVWAAALPDSKINNFLASRETGGRRVANEMQVGISWEFLGQFSFSNMGASLSLPLAFLPGMWMQGLDLQQPSWDTGVMTRGLKCGSLTCGTNAYLF